MRRFPFALLLLACCCGSVQAATVLKCQDAQGKVTFTQDHCPAGTAVQNSLDVSNERPSGANGPSVQLADPAILQPPPVAPVAAAAAAAPATPATPAAAYDNSQDSAASRTDDDDDFADQGGGFDAGYGGYPYRPYPHRPWQHRPPPPTPPQPPQPPTPPAKPQTVTERAREHIQQRKAELEAQRQQRKAARQDD
ncbi:MAG: hypothetical protein GAK43_02144 [Stenotrophomonas maltophilia]|nr:MAG: hypothetical protein GAK43_02144 [Stenotrophomonas maltophilia]